MSKFFAQAGSDSETESDESDDQQIIIQKPIAITKAYQLSDDEEETKRLVRSAKDKREEEITNIAKQMKNHRRIKDMCKVLSDFEDLQKAYAKTKGVLDDKDGNPPHVFVKCLVELEDFVNECWEDKDYKKLMSKNNSRGLSSLRQKLKKYAKDFEPSVLAYREKMGDQLSKEGADKEDLSDMSEGEGENYDKDDSEAESDTVAKPIKSKPPKPPKTLDEDEDSMEWPSSESDEESSSDDEKYAGNMAAKFLKKQPDKEKEKKKERAQKSAAKGATKKVGFTDEQQQEEDQDEDGAGKWESVTAKGGVARTGYKDKVQLFAPDEEIKRAVVLKKLTEIVNARGKRGLDRAEPLAMLQELYNLVKAHEVLKTDYPVQVKILFNLIASYFDYNSKVTNCMKPVPWSNCLKYIGELIKLLQDNPEIHVGTHEQEEHEELQPDANGTIHIKGCVLSLLEIADGEFTKILQNCDAHSTEYIDRLKDEKTMCNLIIELQHYLEKRGTQNELCRIYYRRVEHMYYKNDPLIRQIFKMKRAKKLSLFTDEITEAFFTDETVDPPAVAPTETENENDPETLLKIGQLSTPSSTNGNTNKSGSSVAFERFCKYIYAHDETGRMRTRAILCHIYYCALHDDWYKARDLLLMSHLQDTIHHSDLATQTLYNRAMVQLGLCAFRHALLKEAHDALLDIQSSGRSKELLGQGLLSSNPMVRGMEPLTPDQEKAEKLRQVPFHAHINLDVLEFVYLFCAMCLETPYIVQGDVDKRRMGSKNFYYQLRQSERQLLIGPPDNIRDHIVAAHKSMKTGDWKTCRDYIINDKTKTKVWDLFPDSTKIYDMITQKIKSECLRVYLFAYGNFYDSLDLARLSEMFDLDIPTITNVLSKMIINEEITATFDEPSQALIMHRVDLNRIQSIVSQLTEKISQFSEFNDKLAELKWMGQGPVSLYATNPFSSNQSNVQGKTLPENYYTYNPSHNYRK